MSAVFQEINSGKPVTTGLKKVTGDMKTKNCTDRTVGTAPEKPAPRAGSFSFKTGPPQNGSSNGPQIIYFISSPRWVVENQVGKKNLVIDDCDSKQSVYVFGCKDFVLQVKGKVNNITLDKCTKTGILFTDVVAAFEVVNCNGVEVQYQRWYGCRAMMLETVAAVPGMVGGLLRALCCFEHTGTSGPLSFFFRYGTCKLFWLFANYTE